jgi:D-alanine-D-alanine ligase
MAHVLILHNEPILPTDHPEAFSEAEVLLTVQQVTDALSGGGHQVSRLGVGADPSHLVEQLRSSGAEVVFNLFEGLADRGETEPCVAGLLEWLGLPFTGSASMALSLARDKPAAKLLLCGARLPTPDFLTLEVGDKLRSAISSESPSSMRTGKQLRWPLIVKPANLDASVGIDQGSVVKDLQSLQIRVEHLFGRYGTPVLIEEYIDGRELTVGVIEVPHPRKGDQSVFRSARRALPVSEFELGNKKEGWPIITYDAKWRADSTDFALTPYRDIADVPADWSARLTELALLCFAVLGLRDYARIDFRVTASGEPFILEANPNPDLHPTAGLGGVLDAVGITYAGFINGLIERALARRDKGQGTRDTTIDS